MKYTGVRTRVTYRLLVKAAGFVRETSHVFTFFPVFLVAENACAAHF